MLYPLKFTPISKYRIWGGTKLNTVLNKGFKGYNIGESWEISAVKGDETQVANGALIGKTLKELISEHKGDIVGNTVFKKFGNEFPLLIKFIDAKTPLSIQVHPSDEIAKQRHQSFGKNEMWYVMQADENAELIVGFDNKINQETYQEYIDANKVLDVMHHEKVKKGDTFYIPTGRLHAIGAGVLLAEIQQTSNITYRIYDYDRVDAKTGEKRELHSDLALDAIDFEFYDDYKTVYDKKVNVSKKLVHSPYFKTNIIEVSDELEKNYTNLDSFVIYMGVSGSAEVTVDNKVYSLKTGETLLFPAKINQVKVNAASAVILEIYL